MQKDKKKDAATLETFEPYRKEDVKVGKDGYVRVHVKDYGHVWATAYKRDKQEQKKSGGGEYGVQLLGSGPAPTYELSEFTPEEQKKLLTTV